jgi:putative DNA methylase
MSVRTALALINQTLTEVLSEQEDEFDNDTRWAIAWYEQHGFEEGEFGDADVLARAKNTSVNGMVDAGILWARQGREGAAAAPRRAPERLGPSSRPSLHDVGGNAPLAPGLLLREARRPGHRPTFTETPVPGRSRPRPRYRLFAIAEKKGRSQDAQAYNALVLGWAELARLAREPGSGTGLLFGGRE